MAQNEIGKLHFEIKRLNHQLNSLRSQLKSTVETVADLRTQVMHLRNPVQPGVPETVPTGVGATVPGPTP